jgi:putative phosphoribosyl transferase
LRKQKPRQIVIAVPTAAPDTCEEFRAEVDDIICAMTPAPFHAVGEWYEDFPQNTDAEVQHLLRAARNPEINRGDRV